MNIIFLDIDGVLATLRVHLALKNKGGLIDKWDPVGASFIKKICQKYNVQIVISSTWRLFKDGDLMLRLKEHHLHKYLHNDYKTKRLTGEIRGKEIKEWLSRHPEVENYLILDDDTDMLKEQMPYFVRTQTQNGITTENMEHILEWATNFC